MRINHCVSNKTKFWRRIIITDQKIYWDGNDGDIYCCEWEEFIKCELSKKFNGMILLDNEVLFDPEDELWDKNKGDRIYRLLNSIVQNINKILL